MKDGVPVTKFLGLISVKSGTAEGISVGLDTFLTELGISNWKSKLIGLGTSVNVGSQGGLSAIL